LLELTGILKNIRTIEGARSFLESKVEISDRILQALNFAVTSHSGQKRKSGEDYVVHPILVAAIVAHFGGDTDMIVAALLHDVVEDTHVNKSEIENLYGKMLPSWLMH